MLSKDREAHADSLGRAYKAILDIDPELPSSEVKKLAKEAIEAEISAATGLI